MTQVLPDWGESKLGRGGGGQILEKTKRKAGRKTRNSDNKLMAAELCNWINSMNRRYIIYERCYPFFTPSIANAKINIHSTKKESGHLFYSNYIIYQPKIWSVSYIKWKRNSSSIRMTRNYGCEIHACLKTFI